ncbi:flavin-containing monooxygenase [Massilia sp. SM-13]|uniref:flavin-containing monooxygenase n=1 Tax=Pseudoduganella rhizocola TaxID=3382643 RepID=UPI0038B43B65
MEEFDVLIVGAGLSGIGAAHQLQQRCPDKRFLILEGREAIGGTWDLFRYPGVRSDSDMYTLGYGFRPWTDPKAIADGPAILRYIRETAAEAGLARHIRFGHRVVSAAWSSSDASWVLEAECGGERRSFRARFLCLCSGYYDYEEGHRPEFADEQLFRGRLVQPQFWPEGLDYSGKRVIVIGSGATAVTLVPAMAETAAHVTMLQRSPTYIVTRPSVDGIARRLRRMLPERAAWWLTRWKNIVEGIVLFRLARSRPEIVKEHIVRLAAKESGLAREHFTPDYKPWDQRVCVVPDGDLFRAIREGKASVATDTIERFTPDGIVLGSGRELAADVVVIATGLKLRILGGMAITIDGLPFEPSQAMAYKGMMLSGLPNCAMTFGYTNASWTLKADLTAAYVCRLLRFMDRKAYAIAVPQKEADVSPQPFLSFTSGYVQRAIAGLPKQGSRRPWQVYQNYIQDLFTIRYGAIGDGVMRFGAKGRMP